MSMKTKREWRIRITEQTSSTRNEDDRSPVARLLKSADDGEFVGYGTWVLRLLGRC